MSTSQYPENQPRNRKGHVFPYEDTRAMLHPNKRNRDGYINASNVQVPIGDKLIKYIVSQAPMKNTVDDFWQMVWDSGAQVIVALANAQQSQQKEAFPVYWPTKLKEKCSFADFFVKLQNVSTSKHQTTSVLALKHIATGERRTVYHLRFPEFNQSGIPNSEDSFLAFIDAVSSVKRHIENENMLELESGTLTARRRRSASKIGPRTLNIVDVTNKNRSQSVEGGAWRRKLTFGSSNGSPPLRSPLGSTGSYSDRPDQKRNSETTVDELLDHAPTIVHCTDGASESGVYMLVEILVHCIENNVNVDVAQLLKSLRQQRMCLIRSIDQYRFCHAKCRMFGYLGYGAASAVLGAVLYANLPTKYTIGAIVPTAKFLAEAKLKKINGEKDLLTAKEIKAAELFEQGPVLVMAVRRPGCMLCRQEAKNLNSIRGDLDKHGVRLLGVVHEAFGVEEFKPYLDADIYYDVEKRFYGPNQRWLPHWMGFLRISTYLNAYGAKKSGVHGNMEGEGRLLGGVYLINKDQMVYSHLERDWGDHADPNEIRAALKRL
ncbi:protein-tyrosine phosphatase [Aphelenchoides avenae]|nr:protein-tyrosine phosphatase [Aphelenchus avenae]